MTLHRSRLQYRFLAGTLAAAVLFALIAGTLAYRLGERRANAAAHQTIASVQAAVEKTAAIAVFAHDTTLMREVIEGVARNPLVRQVDIVDANDKTLLQGASTAEPVGGTDSVVRQPLKSPFDPSETIGAMRIEIDSDELQHVARREAWLMALLMVGQAALIAMTIYLAGARLVSRPIVRLARALTAMPPGTTERLPAPRGHEHDEIGTLVQSANDLLSANAQALARERELRQDIEAMEAQYRQIFDSTSAGIFVLDRQGRLINGNPTVMKVIGGGVGDLRQLRGQDFLDLVFARPERARAMIDQASLRNETMSADLELRSTEGRTRWAHCLLSVQDATPAAGGAETDPVSDGVIEGVLYDITERKEVESDVRRRAEHDALTGALNRAGIDAAIDRFLAHGDGDDALSLLYLDLDGFKQINDRHGHHRGDEVLQQAVTRIQGELRRNSDLVGRIGGDEFVIALAHSGPTDLAASQLAANIVARLCEPFELGGDIVVEMGVSTGMPTSPRHGRHRRELMHAADEAMYWVKRHGKNAYAAALTEA